MGRRYVVLTVVVASILAALALSTKPLQAAASSLGVSWNAAQRWVSSLGSKTSSPIERAASLLRPQQSEQGGGQAGPTIATSKPDYHPGEIVVVTGSGWSPGSTVTLTFHEVLDDPFHVDGVLSTVADSNGHIDTSRPDTPGDDYLLEDHDVGVTYVLTATGFAGDGSAAQATTTFTDSAAANIDQCRNGSATSPSNCVDAGADPNSDNGVGWVNGNAGQSNSHYIEGYSIPYRVRMTDLPVGTPITIDLGYDIKHSSKNAIDFLTHYQRLEPHLGFGHAAETVFPLSGTGLSGSPATFAIPEPSSTGAPPQPSTRFNSLSAGERLMSLWGGTFNGVGIEYVSEGDLSAAQAETVIRIHFTPTTATALLAWGGHIAVCSDWSPTATGSACASAAGISGSPYHMRLKDWECDDGFDGTKQNTASQCDKDLGNLGNQDRSLSAAAVFPTGNIIIRKFVVSGTAGEGSFAFTGLGGFNLSSGGSFGPVTVLANAGTGGNSSFVYQVTEQGPADGYDFDRVECNDSDSIEDNSTQTADIKVSANETVTCDFFNTKDLTELFGRIIVKKVTVPTGDPQSFAFTASYDSDGFNLSDGQENDTNFSVAPGSHSVAETTPTGWTLTSSTCSSTQAGDASTPASIALEAGETVTCTFTNTKNGDLKLVKNTVGGDGGPFPFTHTITGLATSLSTTNGTANDTSDSLAPGATYAVSEGTLPTGWDFTSASCTLQDGGSTGTVNAQAITAITVEAGKTTTCTFTNIKRGDLKLVKNTVGGDGGPFPFTHTITGLATSLSTTNGTANDTSDSLAPGATYAVSEGTLPTGWDFTSAACTLQGGGSTGTVNGQAITAITVETGKTTTCTFTNTKRGYLKLVKNTVGGDGGPFPFTHAITGLATSLSTTNGTANDTSDWLAAGTTYAVSEGTLPTGWDFTSAACTLQDGGSTGTVNGQAITAITVETGKTTTCTFTNTKRGYLKLVKNTVGGDGTFPFTHTITGLLTSLTTSGGTANDTSDALVPGTYAVSEGTVPTGWDFTSAACTVQGGGSTGTVNGQAITAITVETGKTTTCTFTNTKRGKIIVQKVIKPTGSLTSFSFDADGGTAPVYTDFSLAGGQTNEQVLKAGSYTVKELVPLGWVLTGIGGSTDPNTPYNCTVTGGGGSTGVGDLNTQTATISLKSGDTVTCVFENTGQGVTRTQGFWATHSRLAKIAWFGGTAFGHTFPGVAGVSGIGDRTLCGRALEGPGVDDISKVMGAMWSDISKTTTGAKRSALDQARMQLLQQLIAAELNASAFGSVPSSGSFAAWESAYCGTNTNTIKNAQQQAASFNTAGDSSTFTPGTSADSKNARAIADYLFWNLLP